MTNFSETPSPDADRPDGIDEISLSLEARGPRDRISLVSATPPPDLIPALAPLGPNPDF